jgi:two-component system NtrC family sensor kinase
MSNIREAARPSVAAPAANRHTEWLFRLLIVASLALPIAIFAIASWISYGDHFAEAQDRLQRTLGIMDEHAVNVFETADTSERYLEELFNDVSDAEIRRNEAAYSARIRHYIKNLPELDDLAIIGRDGHPLVSGTVYPMPHDLDLANRNYFHAQEFGKIHTYINKMAKTQASNTWFFVITRKRLNRNGQFDGVYLVSITPEYFTQYYAHLSDTARNVAGLIRGDGMMLARDPQLPRLDNRFSPNSTLMSAIRRHPQSGLVTGPAYFDKTQRLYAYSKLPHDDAYVFAGINVDTVRAKWMQDMSIHLIFGIPATLAMFALAVLTLRNTRKVSLAYTQLREETARRETTEATLRQAQKMEAVGRLTGGIAHDFNNMLTAIIGNVELALRRSGSGDERLARSLSAIRQASLRAATLVQRLLSFSRQHPQEVKTVDINRLVRDMSELLYRTIGETVTVETVLASGLWKTAIDPNQLENAILNLAVNARDAMPDGGRLTIETSNAYLDEAYAARAGGDVKAGQYVMVAISDTGAGMPAEVRDRAFEPFFTTKPAGTGTGLGLSMVYGFVKQSTGHIRIYSEAGQGTSIKMYFPRLANEATFPAPGTIEETIQPQRSTHHERILLVEDDEDVRDFVAEALADLGYRVELAGTAADGLELLKKNPDIALLFTDVVLPGRMNGRELANEANKMRPDLLVLFATGYTRNAIIHHGRLDANVELLVKPFTTEALARKVRQVLDSASPPTESA